MLVEEIVARVKRDFGDEYDVIITDIDVYRWIYAGEMEVIRQNGGNVHETAYPSTSFPSDITDNITIRRVDIGDRALFPTTRNGLDILGFSTTSVGSPKYWYIADKKIYLWPVAETAETVTIEYNKLPTPIVGPPPSPMTLSIPENWHTDLVNFVMARANEKRGNLPKSLHFQEQFDKNMGKRNQESDGADVAIYKIPDPLDYEEF